MKYLIDIIKDQNRLLEEARQTIVALGKERDTFRGLLRNAVPDLSGENRVKALLALNGIKQKSIADKLGVEPQTVSQIVLGKKNSARIRSAIAKVLNMKVEELWPSNGQNNHGKAA